MSSNFTVSLTLTPAYEVVDAEGRRLVEDVSGDLGVEVDPLYEHPEDGGLEAEHEGGQHGMAEPGLCLVPNILPRVFLLDVGGKVDWEELFKCSAWRLNVS